jgi:hypothetical protein
MTHFGRKIGVGCGRLQHRIYFEKLCKGRQLAMVRACKHTFLSSFFWVDGCNNFVEICHGLVPYDLFQSMILDYLGLCHFSLDFRFVHVLRVFKKLKEAQAPNLLRTYCKKIWLVLCDDLSDSATSLTQSRMTLGILI